VGQIDAVCFRDKTEYLPITVKTPRPTRLTDLQRGFAIPVKKDDTRLAGWIFVCELDRRRAVPLDVNHRDKAIRQDSLDGDTSGEIF
jgi:hypothetical protein